MSRVLVFGGSGFIGSQVQAALHDHPEADAVITPGRDRCDLVHCTVAELADLLSEERPDAVVNCAGRLAGATWELLQANTVVTAKIIDAISRVAPGTRFVRLGSASEYGVVAHGHAVAEGDPASPVSAYGFSHLAGTRMVQMASTTGDVDGVVLRVFDPIGPGLHEEDMLGCGVKHLCEAIRTGADHITMRPLSAWRDFVDVRDLAAAVCTAALRPSVGERVVNVASGVAVQSRTAMELLAAAAGFHGQIREEAPGPTRSAAVDWLRGDISRAARTLQWVPSYALAESMKAIWAGVSKP